MRKVFGLLVGMTVLGCMLVGCGSVATSAEAQGGADGTSSEASAEGKVLRVGMECAYAPFNWTQSSEEVPNGDKALPIFGTGDYAYGYDVMLAQKLADELGYTLEIHKVDWSSLVLGLNSGDFDAIIAGMGYTEDRAKAVDFTDPYYIRNNVLVVKKDGPLASATKLSDFKGVSATTQLGTTWELYVPQIPDVKALTNMETTSEVIMSVAMGGADCGIVDEPTAASAQIANPDITYIKLADEDAFTIPEGQSLDVCIAVKKGNDELKEALNSALSQIEWDEAKMTELMDLAIQLQPLSKE